MILGIDPGLANTGWAVLQGKTDNEDLKLIECGVIKTKKELGIRDKESERLKEIYDGIEKLIKKYKVTEMAVESLFFAKNAKSAIKVAEAIGVIKVCGQKNGVAVFEYTPLQVKMSLVGYGRAEKDQVEVMVRSILGLSENIKPSHASDAVAVGLTHGTTMRF